MTKSWPKFARSEALESVKGKLKSAVVVSQEMFSMLESCCAECWSLVCNHLVTLTQHSSFTADGKVVLISLSEFPLVQSSLIISPPHVRPAPSSSTKSCTVYLEVNLLLSLALALVEEGVDDPVSEGIDGKFWYPDQRCVTHGIMQCYLFNQVYLRKSSLVR